MTVIKAVSYFKLINFVCIFLDNRPFYQDNTFSLIKLVFLKVISNRQFLLFIDFEIQPNSKFLCLVCLVLFKFDPQPTMTFNEQKSQLQEIFFNDLPIRSKYSLRLSAVFIKTKLLIYFRIPIIIFFVDLPIQPK